MISATLLIGPIYTVPIHVFVSMNFCISMNFSPNVHLPVQLEHVEPFAPLRQYLHRHSLRNTPPTAPSLFLSLLPLASATTAPRRPIYAALPPAPQLGTTPLMAASANGHKQIVTALHAAGADCNAKNGVRGCPLRFLATFIPVQKPIRTQPVRSRR